MMSGAELLLHWKREFCPSCSRVRGKVDLYAPLAAACVSGSCSLLDRVAVGRRAPNASSTWCEGPTRRAREHYRKSGVPKADATADAAVETPAVDVAMQGNQQKKPKGCFRNSFMFNAHHTVQHLKATRRLHDVGKSDECFEAQLKARLSPAMAEEVLETASARQQPARSYIYRAVTRFHIACMLLSCMVFARNFGIGHQGRPLHWIRRQSSGRARTFRKHCLRN